MIRPLLDKVVVAPIGPKETTKGGILIPGGEQANLERGTVLAVGPGYYDGGILIEAGVAQGDTVLYPRFAGTEYSIPMDDEDDLETVIISSRDLVAIEEDD